MTTDTKAAPSFVEVHRKPHPVQYYERMANVALALSEYDAYAELGGGLPRRRESQPEISFQLEPDAQWKRPELHMGISQLGLLEMSPELFSHMSVRDRRDYAALVVKFADDTKNRPARALVGESTFHDDPALAQYEFHSSDEVRAYADEYRRFQEAVAQIGIIDACRAEVQEHRGKMSTSEYLAATKDRLKLKGTPQLEIARQKDGRLKPRLTWV